MMIQSHRLEFCSFQTQLMTSGLSSDGLLVSKSLLPGAGLGLFAARDFVEGETICRYQSPHGTMTTREAVQLEDKSFLMRLGPQTYVDLKHVPEVKARYINDCRQVDRHNVRFLKRPDEGYADVVAMRDIQCGEELYVDYGRFYWFGSKTLPSKLAVMNEG
uniref:SET domain-containing protein n=1 Tax=Hanusia phi TaxID=3032 RepID=A0A7S0DXQ9_9CRYP